MKNLTACLVIMMISGSAFAAVTGHSGTARTASLQCDPGSCFMDTRAGNELTQGLRGYERQVARVLEPVNDRIAVHETR